MKATCLNLKELFGDRFKIEFEESYFAEKPAFRAEESLWLTQIPCQFGHIFPWGDRNLAASTNRPGAVARRLKALPFVNVAQDGDDALTAVFDVEHFDEVAQIMKPRKRRRLSPEQRAAQIERLAKYQFSSARHVSSEAQECEASPSVV